MRDMIRFAALYLAKDEKGAALIEYTVLLGILVATVIGSVVWTGGWVGGKWTTLTTTLGP